MMGIESTTMDRHGPVSVGEWLVGVVGLRDVLVQRKPTKGLFGVQHHRLSWPFGALYLCTLFVGGTYFVPAARLRAGSF